MSRPTTPPLFHKPIQSGSHQYGGEVAGEGGFVWAAMTFIVVEPGKVDTESSRTLTFVQRRAVVRITKPRTITLMFVHTASQRRSCRSERNCGVMIVSGEQLQAPATMARSYGSPEWKEPFLDLVGARIVARQLVSLHRSSAKRSSWREDSLLANRQHLLSMFREVVSGSLVDIPFAPTQFQPRSSWPPILCHNAARPCNPS